MNIPKIYNKMELVKIYKNFAQYSNGKWSECFSLQEIQSGEPKRKELKSLRIEGL